MCTPIERVSAPTRLSPPRQSSSTAQLVRRVHTHRVHTLRHSLTMSHHACTSSDEPHVIVSGVENEVKKIRATLQL